MKKITIAITTLAILGTACTSKKATTGEKSTADVVADLKKNFTDADMSEGKLLWQSNCNKCHKLYNSDDYSVSKWENILPRMIKRAKLDNTQASKVRAYLLTNAKL